MPHLSEMLHTLQALTAAHLPPSRYVVWSLLRARCASWPVVREVAAPQAALARESGLSPREVRRAVIDLVACGLLVPVGASPGRVRTHRLTDPYALAIASREAGEAAQVAGMVAAWLRPTPDAHVRLPRTPTSAPTPDAHVRTPRTPKSAPAPPNSRSSASATNGCSASVAVPLDVGTWAARLAAAAGDPTSAVVYARHLAGWPVLDVAALQLCERKLLAAARRASAGANPVANPGAYGLRLLRCYRPAACGSAVGGAELGHGKKVDR